LRYRTTHLYDDTWFHYCYNWCSCEYTNRPREIWKDDARYDGVSANGQQATFQYGPVDTPEQPWSHPAGRALLVAWADSEWKKLPVGVQIK
jgi:hypothetical protein